MKIEKKILGSVIGIGLAAITACGGGGGSVVAGIDGTGVTPPVSGGSSGSIFFGTVTGFGSIYVNGVRFDTSSTDFDIDGVSGDQDDLDIGDVVLVIGSRNDANSDEGVASRVIFDDAVEGPIESGSIDLVEGTLVVLGQTVRVNEDTIFDDSIPLQSLEGLNDGDVVEVSGFASSDGSILASRIELKTLDDDYEITGRVRDLDTSSFRFNINGLEVDYTSAVLDDFPANEINLDDLVEVEGDSFNPDGSLIATDVEYKGDDYLDDDRDDYLDDDVEIEGLITRFDSSSDFAVNGIPVTVNSGTEFEDGQISDLALDVKVEVEGEFNQSGILVAEEISFKRESDIRIAAIVEGVDTDNNSFTILGITVNVDDLTRLEDSRDDDDGIFSILDLAIGDYVEVRGREIPADSGEVLASYLERDDLDDGVELRGFIENISEPSFTILGVTIDTDSSTEFEGDDDIALSSQDFFSQLQEGLELEVQGVESGMQTILAEEVEIESDDD